MLSSYRTAVTIVSKSSATKDGGCDKGVVDGSDEDVPVDWEALRLELSREDLSRNTEIEMFIISDLIIRHQNQHNKF